MIMLIVILFCCFPAYDAATAIIDGVEEDCSANCVCCRGGVERCGFQKGIGDNYCLNGCVDGIWGHICRNRCPGNCSSCDPSQPKLCFACLDTFYDKENLCNKSCSVGCKDGLCLDSGICDCSSNFEGTHCDHCIEGIYGSSCAFNCLHQNCRSADETECHSCKPGFFNTTAFCVTPCSVGCINFSCNNDGNCACRESFTGSRCTDCIFGIYGVHCNRLCSKGCFSGSCLRNGTCSLCYPGYYGDMCHELCSFGCVDEVCMRNGTCRQECIAGYYGDQCNAKCSTGCVDEVCIRNGTCLECIAGFHGPRCNLKYSQGCTNRICIRDGSCTKCISDFCGENCNISCKQGAFLRNNTYSCIDNVAGFQNHETETDGISPGLTVVATFIGFVAGLIISLIGVYIWKRQLFKHGNENIDMATSTGDTINGGLTFSPEQDVERLVQDERRNSSDQTVYDMCETTFVQHGTSEDAYNEPNEDSHN